jgi:hypothetical protein
MEMSEMQREEILASRIELIEKANMKRQLKQMVRDQNGAASDSVSRAAKSKLLLIRDKLTDNADFD